MGRCQRMSFGVALIEVGKANRFLCVVVIVVFVVVGGGIVVVVVLLVS